MTDAAVARRVFTALEQIGAVLYLQQFVPHDGVDWRLLVIGDEVLGMRRINPDDWRTNISLGARAEPLEVTAELAATGPPRRGGRRRERRRRRPAARPRRPALRPRSERRPRLAGPRRRDRRRRRRRACLNHVATC